MDAVAAPFPTAPSDTALEAVAQLGFGAGVTAGPGTGLVDRLREMTVRTPVVGRPIRVPLRR
jgi:hypothetical protein